MGNAGRGDSGAGDPDRSAGGGRSPDATAEIEQFGIRVQARREALGLTQEAVARRAAIHEASVGRIERGQRNATYVTMMRIARALEIEPRRLLEGPVSASDLAAPDRRRGGIGSEPPIAPPGGGAKRAVDRELVEALGLRLYRQRRARKLSQRDVADRAGVHWSFIGQVERGERNIRFRSLVQIAHGLGGSPAELFGDSAESDE